MIKTGIILTPSTSPSLIRLLLRHPDVELRWVAGPGVGARGVAAVFDELTGESPEIPCVPDWADTDLYIGPATADVEALLTREGSSIKAIFPEPGVDIGGYPDGMAALGVAEYNRKALVRGARVASQPEVVTLLCSLAVMPLARHLLLGDSVVGTAILPPTGGSRNGGFTMPGQPLAKIAFKELRENVLNLLQTSCNTDFCIYPVAGAQSTFAAVTLGLTVNMQLDEIVRLYDDFYGDHRHVVVAPGVTVTEAMVARTNKSVISMRQGADRSLWVTVGFDAAYKAGAGNVVHLLNLIFGLDERTGLSTSL